MQTNNQLLERYAQGGSQYAFQELVERHINLVHSAALRESLGDVSRAEDITQAVFVELARQANRLVAHPALSGWLYTCVRRMTANVRRSEQRRQRREQESFTMSKILEPDPLDTLWQEVRPELDNVMHELAEKDRTAVVLRYFEGRTLKEVGLALGLTENAARMRLERSLEKLRLLLSKRGVKSTASTLATALTAGAVLTAPSILATKVVSAAMTEVTRETTAFSMERILRFLKTKPMIAGMVLALLGGLIGSRSLSGSASTRIVAKVETNSPTVSAAPVLNKQDVVTDASSSPAPSQMLVQVIETETGKPLSRAKAHLFYIRQDGRGETSKGLAGADGIIPVEGIRKPFRGLNMFISAAGHVPRVATWGFGVDMPAEYTMKLEKATTVGGLVIDEFSKPISGATLSFHCRNGSYVTADHIGFGPDTNTRTDEDGRWSCNMVPQDLQNLDIDVTHPLFAKSSVVLHPSSAQANHFTITLSSGIDFKGTVTDIGGNPIESARIREVFIHSDTGRSTVTDKMGNFELLHLKPGEVTLVAEAEAYAAAVQTVQSTASVAALRFQLGPGKVIRGRVSDEEGNAIAGAFVETSRGRNKIEWSTTTDASGRFEWNSAPTEPLLYSFQAEEFNRAYAIPLPADGSEHLITLTREHLDQDMIRIQGTVSDAESGKPIDAFNVLQSDIEADAAFPFDFRTIGKNGTFSFSVRADSNHPKFQLQIETPGYRPAVSPEYFRKDGNQTITFKLRKAGPIEGIVLLPDGAPAENASVFLCTSRAGVVIDGPARVGTGLNITPN
ncbi:MAG: polymerase sigma factor, sigma-70 family, partial [Verrucomicrobiales bacterium]|nr:polymerase sigma factor, sigma-70 family [Verrucomicrobiales bacterium]